jgi:O-antigen/teichoic acid export membrane protein
MYSEIKETLKHSIVYVIGAVLPKAIGFILIPIYTRYLTPFEYGILALLTISSSIFFQICSLSLGIALVRTYNSYIHEKERIKVFNTAFFSTIFVSLMASISFVFVSKYISNLIFRSSEYSFFLCIIFITIFFDSSNVVIKQLLVAQKKSVKYVSFSVPAFFVQITLTIFFVVFLNKGVLGVIGANLIVSIGTFIVLLLSSLSDIKRVFSFNILKDLLLFSLPFIPENLCWIIFEVSDRFFLDRYCSTEMMGIYSLGYKFGQVIYVLLVFPFSYIFIPMVMSVKDKPYAKEYFKKMLTYIVYVGFFMSMGLSILSKDIITIMIHKSFWGGHKVIPLLAVSYSIYAACYIFEAGIIITRKTIYIFYAQLIATVISLIFYSILIPFYGMMGAALATFIGFLSLGISKYIFSNKLYSIRFEWRRIVKIALTGGIIYFLTLYLNFENIAISITVKCITALLFPVVLYLIGFYEQKEKDKVRQFFFNFSQHLIINMKTSVFTWFN